MRIRRGAVTLASAAVLVALTGCGAAQPPGGSAPWEAAGPGRGVAEAAVGWLVDGPGGDALGEVPGSTWSRDPGLRVRARCGLTDRHEGWTLSGRVVPADAAGEAFDGGEAFATAQTGGGRTWVHVEHGQLRLVERGDGGIDVVLAVADVDADAAAWHAVDRVDVEVVFAGERCG